ncbi:SMI1 / KNR4 family [[Clostridium] sordellii]|uniref:SMI1/KNR4 family protein n=1 Tax=Paraclostridium sordellii TaxID=1505 RepID=UPI0005E8E178|nr:SMI1/KNR4 family protein [Paeniclostridium sordellii]CEP45648.1 SMI1 / KNR4 family [[Clostridium] sordellii] [Paeniclostridium sordellii]
MRLYDYDFSNFWDDCSYSYEQYICESPTDTFIEEIEQELGYKLPMSYIWLMRQHNGGIPINTCFPIKTPTSWAEDHIKITGIMGIGRDKPCSICGELGSRFMIEEWGYPNIGIAICDCPSAGHDMIFLDYRKCGPQGEPQVVHIDQDDDYNITILANTFEEFIIGLVNDEVYDT